MTNPDDAPVGTTFRGRLTGIVLRDTSRAKGYLFLTDGSPVEYFAHKSGFLPQALFDSIQMGQPVTFRASRTTKGFKAFDVQEASAAEAASVAELIEDRLATTRANAVREQELRREDDRGNR